MRVADWFFAARPLLHIPGWSIFLVALHYHHQLSGGQFTWIDLIVMLSLSLLAAGGFYLNQVTDLQSDRINKKCLFLPNGIFQRRQFVAAFIICSVVAVGVSVILATASFLIFIQLFALMFFYSSYPFRWKDNPVGGLLVNAYGNGFLVAMAVFPGITIDNAGLLGWDNPFYFLFAVAGIYALTTIPDQVGDAAEKKQTIAVVFGRNAAIWTAIVCFALAAWTAWGDSRMVLCWFAVSAAAASLLAWKVEHDAILMLAIKLPILELALLAAWFYPAYLAILVVCIFATRVYYRKRFSVIYPRLAA